MFTSHNESMKRTKELEDAKEEISKYLSDMQMDIHELESLVSEMLEYARLDTQQPSLQLAPCDIVALIKTNIEKVNFDTRIKLTTTLPTQFIYSCDSHFMSRVLQNLISNALKPASQSVHISLSTADEKLLLVVEDDGPGIPESERSTLLARGTRLDAYAEGQGIGMAIVSDLIAIYEGKLHIEKSPLGGASIQIKLPIN